MLGIDLIFITIPQINPSISILLSGRNQYDRAFMIVSDTMMMMMIMVLLRRDHDWWGHSMSDATGT
jgi:hypothetical protein